MLNILIHPNPILRKISKEVEMKEITSKKIKKLFLAMEKTMLKLDGAGLSAPQVGYNIRIIVVNTKDGPINLINPKIIKKSWAKEWNEEGCLSVPGVYGKVKRAKMISCYYLSQKGIKTKILARGLLARIIQHEIDHLDGILFIDKAKDIEKVENNK